MSVELSRGAAVMTKSPIDQFINRSSCHLGSPFRWVDENVRRQLVGGLIVASVEIANLRHVRASRLGLLGRLRYL